METTRPVRQDAFRNPVELAEQRLRWLEQRQGVLARNVANADTPGYRPRDLTPFARMLSDAGAMPAMTRTSASHLEPRGGSGPARALVERQAAEESPDGNAVSLDEQALRIADTDTAHALATGLYRRYLGQFRTALGRSG